MGEGGGMIEASAMLHVCRDVLYGGGMIEASAMMHVCRDVLYGGGGRDD